MATTDNRGNFVWYELLTSDPAAAIVFYRDVVGWTTQPFGEVGPVQSRALDRQRIASVLHCDAAKPAGAGPAAARWQVHAAMRQGMQQFLAEVRIQHPLAVDGDARQAVRHQRPARPENDHDQDHDEAGEHQAAEKDQHHPRNLS